MIDTEKFKTQPKLFYGWYIVIIAFMANFMSVGTGFYLMNAFMEPLCEAHGWTRTDISLAPGYGIVFGLLAQLVYGTIVNRVGARSLMLLGSIVSGLAFFMLIRSETLAQFYFYFIVLFVGNAAYGGIVAGTVVNNWFITKRGRAMGLATAGVSFSGAVLPLVAMILILRLGIEQASLFISLLVFMVGPVAWLIVKDWPEDQGLHPDGIDPQVSDDTKTVLPEAKGQSILPSPGASFISPRKPKMQWPVKRLVRNGTFWKLGIAYALLTACAVGVMSQLKPRFADIGFSDMTAMWLMAATAFTGALGKYFWGVICDYFDTRHVASLIAVLNGLGLVFTFVHGSIPALFLFVVIFGFTMGGIMSTYPIIIADFFGRQAFPFVIRFASLFLILQIAGYFIAGQSFDRTGSYNLAYTLFLIFDLAAAMMIWSISKTQTDKIA
jgi:OFA family oxalate/formate antiporter-like MFS transporter